MYNRQRVLFGYKRVLSEKGKKHLQKYKYEQPRLRLRN